MGVLLRHMLSLHNIGMTSDPDIVENTCNYFDIQDNVYV